MLLGGCARFAIPVGTITQPEEAATITGFARYYMIHSSYGYIQRVDTAWPGASTYAVTVAPGPHLIEFSMSQASAANPLLFGGGYCALIIDTAPAPMSPVR